MTGKAPSENRFNWHLPLYAAAGALILYLSIAIYASLDIGALFYRFVATPIIALVLLVIAISSKRRQRISILSMLIIYCVISWGLGKNYDAVRTASRWFLLSKSYKAKVLAQPPTSNGELRHVEWDGWGFAGSDTVVYLVFDPNDSLSTAAKSHSSGKFTGIPCEVPPVRRLESHWYAVMFYTDTAWDQCA